MNNTASCNAVQRREDVAYPGAARSLARAHIDAANEPLLCGSNSGGSSSDGRMISTFGRVTDSPAISLVQSAKAGASSRRADEAIMPTTRRVVVSKKRARNEVDELGRDARRSHPGMTAEGKRQKRAERNRLSAK